MWWRCSAVSIARRWEIADTNRPRPRPCPRPALMQDSEVSYTAATGAKVVLSGGIHLGGLDWKPSAANPSILVRGPYYLKIFWTLPCEFHSPASPHARPCAGLLTLLSGPCMPNAGWVGACSLTGAGWVGACNRTVWPISSLGCRRQERARARLFRRAAVLGTATSTSFFDHFARGFSAFYRPTSNLAPC